MDNINLNTQLLPAFETNNIAICLACSNEYTPFACVTIASILENQSVHWNYDIVLLNTDISENNKCLLLSVTLKYKNVSLRFVNVENFLKDYKFYTWAHFTKFTYYRLLIPDVFSEYEKVIYLDSDVIVNHDISELFETNIENFLLAAAYDTHVVGRLQDDIDTRNNYYIDTVGVKDKRSYFQCGVSIYNIEEFKKLFRKGALIEKAANSELRWLDQDLINILAKGRIKPLNNQWNVMAMNNLQKIDEYSLPKDLYQEYFEARKDPYIFHYIGRSIPCYNSCGDMYYLYWKYARLTPYYELLISRMMDIKIANAINNHAQENSFKRKIKNQFVMPIVNIFFPKSTRRRTMLKKAYFKIRGWEID